MNHDWSIRRVTVHHAGRQPADPPTWAWDCRSCSHIEFGFIEPGLASTSAHTHQLLIDERLANSKQQADNKEAAHG
jgi:hypothetical protein